MDGTFERYPEGAQPLCHRLRLIEDQFAKDAFAVVTGTLQGDSA